MIRPTQRIIEELLSYQQSLCDYLIEKGIITPEQCGFRKKHGTQDSIFILTALIDKYVKSKPKKSPALMLTSVKHLILSPEGNCFKN